MSNRRRKQRKQDPEGRREAILEAAIAVIAEHGVDNATHRLIAKAAGVPLGSTTYYFPTRSDLVAAALEKSSRDGAADLAQWREALRRSPSAATLIELTSAFLADQQRAVIEWELYVAAAREEALRPMAQAWLSGFCEQLEPLAGPVGARAIAMLLEGAMIQALALDKPLDTEALEVGISALLD